MKFTEWQKTRRYVDDLRAATGDDSIDNNVGGFIYEPGYIEESGGAGYCVTVYNEGLQTADLEEAEKFLFDRFVTDL